jgi:hypothetical protein
MTTVQEAFDAIVKLRDEQQKIVAYAEKATKEEDLIKICKKYLQHKGYHVEPQEVANLKIQEITVRHSRPTVDTMCVSREISQTDMLAAAAGKYGSYEQHIKADMARELAAELVHQGFISFKSIQSHSPDTWDSVKRIIGTIQVVKEEK